MKNDYTGLALVVTAIMGPIVAIVTLYFNNRTTKKVHEVAKQTLAVATQVDSAVNGKNPGQSSISEDVTTIMEKQELDVPSLPVEPEDGNGRLALVPMIRYLTQSMEELKASVESQQKKVVPKPVRR